MSEMLVAVAKSMVNVLIRDGGWLSAGLEMWFTCFYSVEC